MIAALLQALRERPRRAAPSGSADEDSPAFVRGLALGAFVGAAIAGSTVWRRLHARARDAQAKPDSATETAAPE